MAYSYIRFSIPDQIKGDSLRRQTAGSLAVCQENGWTLDQRLKLRDLGVSAFRSKNAKVGALSGFLTAVESGQVKTGSVLIVESLDRLSRAEILTALNLFTGILQAGIKIYTLMDRRLYTAESVNANPTDLIISITVMMRAHEESATKSKRVSAAWDQKRANAAVKPLTGKCPGWITLRGGKYELNHHAPTVLRFVQMTIDGHGTPSIARALNQDGTPVMTQKKTVKLWHYSVIQHVIRSRALIGEYQPCRMVDGVASPTGEPIPNYYPALLDEPTFYRLQNAIATRARGKGKGRTGKNVANLFGRLLHDGRDGGVMTLCQKRKKNLNMISLTAVQGLSEPHSFPYTPFEFHFLHWVSEIRLTAPAECHVAAIEGKLAVARSKIDQLVSAMDAADTTTFPRLVEQMKKYEAQERSLNVQLDAEKAKAHDVGVDPAEIGRLGTRMRALESGEELTALRTRIKLAIGSIVDRINVWIFSKGIVRLAIVDVTFKGGEHRLFCMRTARYETPESWSTGMRSTFSWEIDFEAMGQRMIAQAADFREMKRLTATSMMMQVVHPK